jgi:hypothetical protein
MNRGSPSVNEVVALIIEFRWSAEPALEPATTFRSVDKIERPLTVD